MKRKEFFQLVQPLTEKLYRFAYALVPDDLQAEQLIIDCMNAYLIKEKKYILGREIDITSKRETQVMRRSYFRGILKYMADIGVRRANQLGEQMRFDQPAEFQSFYALEPKVRMAIKLRYEGQFNVDEIEEILQIPKYEVIEKIHNGRFLLLNNLNAGVTL